MFSRLTCLSKLTSLTVSQRLFSNTQVAATVPTIYDVRRGLEKLTAFDPNFGDKTALKAGDQKIASQNDLKKEKMGESYAEAIIPLGEMPALRNKYGNFQKGVRFGRLLEDLDTMAVHIAYLHNKSQKTNVNGILVSPIVIVTGSVDQIKINQYTTDMSKNIKLSGFTSWVGRTSCEVTMKIEQELEREGEWVPQLHAKFLMVARNIDNNGSGIMNPLDITNEEEKAIFELGNANKEERIKELKTSLTIEPPNSEESMHIHEMFKKTIDLKSGSLNLRYKPDNTVWMEDTKLKNVIICHPEQRNLYNKIFGGFLMRQAYELAWANACLYSKTTPRIQVVDDISFKKPVLIGSLLFLNSQIVYTEDNQMQIKVLAQAVNPKTNESVITNDFYFKFSVPESEVQLPQVLPKTYSEYMLNIDGRRHMK